MAQHGPDSGGDRAEVRTPVVGTGSLAQVHVALASYHANQTEIDADLEAEARETDALEQQHRR